MDINEKRMNKYIKLYRDLYGKGRSYDEAYKMVISLVSIVEIVMNDYIRKKIKK